MVRPIDLIIVYTALVKIMKKHEKTFKVSTNNKNKYVLTGAMSEKFKKELWFGAVQIKKNYVSYHLMPVYMYSDLVKDIPNALKRRMHGKSCFNFKEVDTELFKQLEELTEKSLKAFKLRRDKIDINC
jgi:hypothetical protein